MPDGSVERKALIRVEGMNFDHYIYDTEDLSTVRGAGLLLLGVAARLGQQLGSAKIDYEVVSDGASVVLLEVPEDQVKPATDAIRDALAGDANLKEATFAVVSAAGGSFKENLQMSMARARWAQMQSPSLVYPELSSHTPPVCEIDRVRPAEHRHQSNATRIRREFGWEEKREFYKKELQRAGIPETDCWNGGYSRELSELAGNSAEWGNLSNKMTLIHLDGNKLGAFFAGLETKEDYQEYSKKLRDTYQAGFLAEALKAIKADPDWVNSKADASEPKARIETLLWGGDELTFVVPAWRGLEFLQLFYNHSSDWTLGRKKITHAGGLVFCHYNAPIHPLARLAKDLAEFVKNTSPEQNQFAYLVLESFDNLSGRFNKTYAERAFPFAKDGLHRVTIQPKQLGILIDSMKVLRRTVPRKRMIEITRQLRGSDHAKAEATMKAARAEMAEEGRGKLDGLVEGVGSENESAVWFHLTELWDYAAPEAREALRSIA